MQYDHLDPTKMMTNELRIHFVTMRVELKYKDEAFQEMRRQLSILQNQPARKKPVWKMVLALLISILFGVTSVLLNIGTSLLTSKPPDPSGNTLIALGSVVFIICTVIQTLIVGGSN
jgi:hypothetical protein